jgi:hypothetical protein
VVAPLTVTAVDAEKLRGINCIAVATPVYGRSSTVEAMPPVAMQPIIERLADEILSLKVLVGAQTGGASVRSADGLSALRKAGADALVMTEILTFSERDGSAIGGEPATVAFVMTVKRTSDGAPVWQGNYFYKQEALSENLLKLGDRLGAGGSGPGWASARAIFERGIEAALRDFGAKREQQFLAGS